MTPLPRHRAAARALLAALGLAASAILTPSGLLPLARAMTVAPAPVTTLASEAHLIVVGRVLWTRVEPVPRRPWTSQTRATVVIWHTYKDALAPPPPETRDLVEVVLPGGTRGGLTTRVPGVPTLHPGEDVLLLLQAVQGGFVPIGYRLGVRRLPRLGQRPPRLPAALAATLAGRP